MKSIIAVILIVLVAVSLSSGAAAGKVQRAAGVTSHAPKPKPTPRLKPRNYSIWIRIGRCEQPGRGYMGINWSHHGPTYQGGLGFYYRTWQGFKPKGFPANAGDATWRQQMQVANILYRRYGLSPWGCA